MCIYITKEINTIVNSFVKRLKLILSDLIVFCPPVLERLQNYGRVHQPKFQVYM